MERRRVAEALRTMGRDEAAAVASERLPEQVDTDAHADELCARGLDPGRPLDHLGRGGLGTMVGG